MKGKNIGEKMRLETVFFDRNTKLTLEDQTQLFIIQITMKVVL